MCLTGIADLENPALRFELDALAAQGVAEIVNMQHTEAVAFYGCLQICRSLVKALVVVTM